MTTGSRNSVSSVENAIANVLLNASGLNSRPSRSPRKKIGRNDVTMISIEKSSGLVIVAVAWMIVRSFSARVEVAPLRASCAVQFSTMTMVASAISPMAMASPASENRLIVWSNAASGSTVNSVPSSSTQTGATAARTFLSATAITRMTTISS